MQRHALRERNHNCPSKIEEPLYRTGRPARRPPEVALVPSPGVSEYHLQLFPDALADVVGVADLPRRDAIVRVRGRRAATCGPERGKMGGAQRARLAALSRCPHRGFGSHQRLRPRNQFTRIHAQYIQHRREPTDLVSPTSRQVAAIGARWRKFMLRGQRVRATATVCLPARASSTSTTTAPWCSTPTQLKAHRWTTSGVLPPTARPHRSRSSE